MKKIIMVFILTLAVKTTVQAKDWSWQVGPNLSFAYPIEKYANATTLGEGLGAKVIYNWGGNEWLSPRLDFVYLSYGSKRSSFGSGPIIETRNESFQLTMGMHSAKPSGAFRYYLSPLAGIFNYRAVMTIPESYYYGYYTGLPPISDTRDSQWKWGARVQGGFLFDIGLGPLIDIGFTYQRIFNVETPLEDGSKIRGDADDFMVTIGVMVFAK
jgi:hypothetical protein